LSYISPSKQYSTLHLVSSFELHISLKTIQFSPPAIQF
jgi:hypothetical protein